MLERLTVRDAALRLGISTATIRRKLGAGELQGEVERRPQGTRWWVLLDTEATEIPPGMGAGPHTRSERDALALALDEVAYLRRKLDEANEGQAELRKLLAMQQETIRMLQPGVTSAQTGDSHAANEPSDESRQESAPIVEQPTTVLSHYQAQKRPWWKVWG
jgi:hypothetical protein